MMTIPMRRFLDAGRARLRSATGATVVAYLLFALIAPMLAAQETSGVPVCCRRSGLHRCVTMPAAGKRVAVSNGQRCPAWPSGLAASHGQVFALAHVLRVQVGFAPQGCVVTRNVSALQIARERQLALRGPPASILAWSA